MIKKKILATTFLQAIGIAKNEILSTFYNFDTIEVKNGNFYRKLGAELIGQRLEAGALPKEYEGKFAVGQRLTKTHIDKLQKEGIDRLIVRKNSLMSRIIAQDVIAPKQAKLSLLWVLNSRKSLLKQLLLLEQFQLKSFNLLVTLFNQRWLLRLLKIKLILMKKHLKKFIPS